MTKKDFISIADFSGSELEEILDVAAKQKRMHKAGTLPRTHVGRTLACIFHKPSLRTRVRFEVAMHNLGGPARHLTAREVGVGAGGLEPVGGGGEGGEEGGGQGGAGECASAFAAEGVAFVGHGGTADVRAVEGLFDLFEVLEQAQVGGEFVDGLAEPGECL